MACAQHALCDEWLQAVRIKSSGQAASKFVDICPFCSVHLPLTSHCGSGLESVYKRNMKRNEVIRSTGIVGGFTLWSRVLGLIRDVLMASLFGTSLAMSGFVVAFTIPNLFRRLFGEGALSAAFVPVYVAVREREGGEAAWMLARRVISVVALFLGIVVLAGIVGISIYLSRWQPLGQAQVILPLLRIMLPYTVFICIAALYMGLLNAHQHFAVSAFAPSLLNVVWIATILLICPLMGDSTEEQIFAVAWGVLLAGVFQWGVQIPKLKQYGYRIGWCLDLRDAAVRRVFRLMGPASLGMAITQINVLVDRLMASWIGPWAPAALFFSERLIYFPQGIFATALSTVLLPVFSRQATLVNHREMLSTINHSLRNLFYVMVPAAVGLFVLARPIVRMIFERGEFTETSTTFTAIALMFYAPGLLVFGLSKVLVPAFYALQDPRTPVKVAFGCVLLKIGLSILFIWTWPLHVKHAGLALATVIGETVNGVVLAWLLHRRLGSPDWRAIGLSAIRCGLAAAAMGVAAWFLYGALYNGLLAQELPDMVIDIGSVLGSIALVVPLYVLLTWGLRAPEIIDVVGALRARFTGTSGNGRTS